MSRLRTCALLSVPLLAAIVADPAVAQDQTKTEEPTATSQEQAPTALSDIVVTAQRRSESVQRVPIAVTAITPAKVELLNLRDVPSLQQVTPGLQFNTGINYAQTYIRGVGYPNTTPGVETSVATYVDGAYLERGFGTIYDVVDPATLQVLKGPQGTLWGRNATGGAILINTADPTLDFAGRVAGEVGNQDHRLGEGFVNVPLSSTFALRVAGRYREDGGYVRNLPDNSLLGARRNWTVRGKLLFRPSSDLEVVGQIQIDRSKRSEGANAEQLPRQFCAFCSQSAFSLPVSDPYTTVVNRINGGVGGRDRSQFYNLHVDYDLAGVSLASVTSYRKTDNFETGDFDYTEVPAFNIAQFSGSKTFTQDLTANFDVSSSIKASTGLAYVNDASYIFLDVFSGPTLPATHTIANEVDSQSISGFAELTAEVAPKLRLTVGGRYTHDARQSLGQRISFNNFTPRAVIAYDAGDLNVYGSYNRGYKAGGFSTPAANPLNVYQPETIDNFELGLKYLSPDRRLRTNLAVFHYVHDDLQVLAVDQGNIGNISQTRNASSKATGFEFEADYNPLEAAQFFGGVSYLAGHFTDFRNAAVQVPVFDSSGRPTGIAAGTENLTGYRLPEAPAWTAFAGATLTAPIGSWKVALTGLVRYTSSFDFYAGAGGPLRADRQPGYTTAKLNGSLTSPDGRYEIGFFIDNLTDATYFDYRFTAAPFGGLQYVARPRSFGLRLGAKFGS